jgi:hypothetical protein
MEQHKFDIWGYLLVASFFILLSYAGYLSYKSIDWTVLQRLESQTLILPTPMPASNSAIPVTPNLNATPVTTKN